MRLLKPIIAAALIIAPGAVAQQSPPPTAWKSGHFVVDTAGLLSRSDIVLTQPNTLPEEAMPLGNGRLGVAVWSAGGLTAQLNRADTLPHRDSPGQLIIPSLAPLASARDFSGRLDLYNGTLVEHGGGITLTAWVQVSTDTFVVDVTGADPNANCASGHRADRKPRYPAKPVCSRKPGSTTTAREPQEKPSAPWPP
jgi:alpha-L-fucosidase 2